jgi:hypothetical protein
MRFHRYPICYYVICHDEKCAPVLLFARLLAASLLSQSITIKHGDCKNQNTDRYHSDEMWDKGKKNCVKITNVIVITLVSLFMFTSIITIFSINFAWTAWIQHTWVPPSATPRFWQTPVNNHPHHQVRRTLFQTVREKPPQASKVSETDGNFHRHHHNNETHYHIHVKNHTAVFSTNTSKPLPLLNDTNLIVNPLSLYLPSTSRRKKEHFVIYSTSDRKYFNAFLHQQNESSIWSTFSYMFPTAQYAKRFNYSYLPHPNTFNYEHERLRGHPPESHYYRIFAALQLMRNASSGYSGPPIDWLVYLDADAFIAEPNLPLEAIVDAAAQFAKHRHSDSDECHFITQEHGAIVNSGFFLVRNSEWSIKFFERWLAEGEKPDLDTSIKIRWVWDQGPLQNAILHVSTITDRYDILNMTLTF